MWAIYRKEISTYFSSLIGYVAICLFLLAMGLYFWVLPQSSLLQYGYADLNEFFSFAPYFLWFLVSVLSMELFASEKQKGTLIWLFSKPISHFELLFSKFLAVVTLTILAILPTFLYVYSLYQLSQPVGNIDLPVIFGSYLGLFLQVLVFSAIGIWCSIQFSNSIVSCLASITLIAFFLFGFDLLGSLLNSTSLIYSVSEFLAFSTHIEDLGRGVLDTRAILYLISLTFLFLLFCGYSLGKLKGISNSKSFLFLISIILFFASLQLVSSKYFKRFDFTEDRRYSLSDITLETLNNISQKLEIQIFLEPIDQVSFRALSKSLNHILQDYKANSKQPIDVYSISPFQSTDAQSSQDLLNTYAQRGMSPIQINSQEGGEIKQKLVFPYLILRLGNEEKIVDLMPNRQRGNHESTVYKNMETLEYVITSSLRKMMQDRMPIVAFTEGHEESNSLELQDAIYSLSPHYQVGFIDLHAVKKEGLDQIDLLIMSKPQATFSESVKFKIDYFVRKGGRVIFAIDQLDGHVEGMRENGVQQVTNRDLNLDDLFFTYGFRMNYDLVADLRSSTIPVASGQGANTGNLELAPWPFHLIVSSESKHPVFSKLSPLSLKYAGTIDTLESQGVKKQLVLFSSPQNRVFPSPVPISLNVIFDMQILAEQTAPIQSLAALLEGEFPSVFQFRNVPEEIAEDFNFIEKSQESKIFAVADGDLFKNEINFSDKSTYPLGWDPFTQVNYGNKTLLLNLVDYMIDDSSLIDLRNKELLMKPLDPIKMKESPVFWQIFNTALPLGFWICLGFLNVYLRKKKYGKCP